MTGIADYEFLERLGEGNHGEFWLAVPPPRLGLDPGRRVAVKTLAQRASEADFGRMANELRIYAGVDSPALTPIIDAGHQNGRLFYAMPHYPDGSLASPARPLDRREIRQAVARAARAAHALHEAGVAHRDIKPSNILLDRGVGYLSDLGLAQIIHPGQTVTGIGPVGTIEFLSPEVVRGERASRASDVWALGVTLHHQLSARPLYPTLERRSLLDALRQVLDTMPVVDPDLADGERAVIERCLMAEPAHRYGRADELAAAIEGLDP